MQKISRYEISGKAYNALDVYVNALAATFLPANAVGAANSDDALKALCSMLALPYPAKQAISQATGLKIKSL